MSDEMNMTPELTLTPNLEGAAAIEALNNVFSLYPNCSHPIIGVQQFECCRQIVGHKFPDLRQFLRMGTFFI